jgi:hypothetical protein
MFSIHKRFDHAKIVLDSNDADVSGQAFFVDGYSIGGRLLDGIDFSCQLDPDGMGLTVSIPVEVQSCFSEQDALQWLEAAIDHTWRTDCVIGIENDQEENWLIVDSSAIESTMRF